MEKLKSLYFLILLCGLVQLNAQKSKAEECYLKATEQYNLGNTQEAFDLVNKALKKDPNFADPYSLLAALHEQQKDYIKAEQAYQSFFKLDSMHALTYFYYANLLYNSNQASKAQEVLNTIKRIPNMPGYDPKKNKISESLKSRIAKLEAGIELDMQHKTSLNELEIKNLGPEINTSAYEYWPGMSMDKKYFFFTRNILQEMQEDLYYSEIIENNYKIARKLPGDINTRTNNEGTVSVSTNGSTIYYTVCNQSDGFGSCDIYFSETDNINWSSRINMGKVINSAQWDAQPSISMGGNVLVFASSRPGGYGGKDLYISYKQKNGQWTIPQNLGNQINSVGDDEAPFLHYDGRTLYYSSSGHDGFGGLDIFVSKLDAQEKWTKPVNIGKYINTSSDESGFYVDKDGKFAYFVSDRDGGFGGLDIYSFTLPQEFRPAPANMLLVKVLDAKTKKPVSGRIALTNLNQKRVLVDTTSIEIQTYYPSGGNFGLFAQANGYLPYSANYFKPLNPNDIGIIDTTIIYLQELSPGNTVVLNNLFFDFDKFELKPESEEALQLLLSFMQNNPNKKLEIGGYTDNKGSDEYNKTLSSQRAASVRNWLIKQGISASKIISKGYGSLPSDDNSTEEKQAKNRRIEIKILN